MDPFAWLLVLCAAMFAGAFGSGYIPLYFSWSERRLRLVTIFGAGLLVGTALIVIIPEGVAMHYESRRAAEAAAALHFAGGAGGAGGAHAAPAAHVSAAAGAGAGAGGHASHAGHAHGRRLLEGGSAFGSAGADFGAAAALPAGARALLGLGGGDAAVAETIASLGSGAGGGAGGGAGAGAAAGAAPPAPVSLLGLTPAAQAAFLASSQPAAHAGGAEHAGENGGGSFGGSGSGGGGGEDAHSQRAHSHGSGHYQIGAALAVGFAFQLLVDRLSGGLHSHTSSAAVAEGGGAGGGGLGGGGGAGSSGTSAAALAAADRRLAAAADGLGLGLGGAAGGLGLGLGLGGLGGASSAPQELNVRANAGGDHSAKSKSAMAGMVVHAFVDGVALGAAVREGDSALGLLVFVAIMLHKAPSSFGLSSYLLHHGISHDGVKRRLLLFSLAAPAGALATFSLLSANLFVYRQEMLALCLLFSGGTFLYVATAHVLPEIQAGALGGGGDDDDDAGGGAGAAAKGDGHGHSHGHSHGHGHHVSPVRRSARSARLARRTD